MARCVIKMTCLGSCSKNVVNLNRIVNSARALPAYASTAVTDKQNAMHANSNTTVGEDLPLVGVLRFWLIDRDQILREYFNKDVKKDGRYGCCLSIDSDVGNGNRL